MYEWVSYPKCDNKNPGETKQQFLSQHSSLFYTIPAYLYRTNLEPNAQPIQ